MINKFFFQIEVTKEQAEYSNKLVDYSIRHHSVQDVFSRDPGGSRRQREFRLTGTIGEVVFADIYKLARPLKSFGAVDGQDYGKDFTLVFNKTPYSVDVKTMHRKNNILRANYVLNLPRYQMIKPLVVTDIYYCISIHIPADSNMIASVIGSVSKKEVEDGTIGVLFKQGTKRIKDNGDYFIFQRDTYEIELQDITSPFLPENVKSMQGFKILHILPPYKK